MTAPIEQRAPGGLGLHLTRRLVDKIEYAYVPERRESRITFRRTTGCRDAGMPLKAGKADNRDDD